MKAVVAMAVLILYFVAVFIIKWYWHDDRTNNRKNW